MKLVHAPTWRTKTLHDQERWPQKRMRAKGKCIARKSTTFATIVVKRVIYSMFVQRVKLLSLSCQFTQICLGDPNLTLVLERWRVHHILGPKLFGCVSLYWLTLMDPSWDGYQNMFERICRYPKMIWRFGVLERFNSVLISSYQSCIDYSFKIDPKMNWLVISLTSYSSLARTCVVGNKD
jgi:hypothetical protein